MNNEKAFKADKSNVASSLTKCVSECSVLFNYAVTKEM